MLDFSKFLKYSKPGPRYTSYPTALEFSDSYEYDEYIKKMENQDSSRPLSLYFHLPFCKNACYFCGCNVVFTSKEDKMLRYIEYLKRELEILSKHLDCKREVIQMHFGGGTPTFFTAEQLKVIIDEIKSYFPNFVEGAEISCEIDPRHIDEDQMRVMSEAGFNRVSFGIQDFNEKVQIAVHRVQPYAVTKDAMDLARKYNMHSVNVDLIYGLPFQTLETFKETLRLALTLSPDRFAVFNYAHVPWMKKTMRKIDETTLPLPDEKLEIMQYTIDFLTSHGYKMVGMDHFAKPDDRFFHTRIYHGAHVIVRNPEKRESLPEKIIATAAGIAAYFSKAKHSTKVPVDFTQIRYVTKPRKSAPGFVIYKNNKTLFVDPINPRSLL